MLLTGAEGVSVRVMVLLVHCTMIHLPNKDIIVIILLLLRCVNCIVISLEIRFIQSHSLVSGRGTLVDKGQL